jgi:hypothetical protein
VGKEPVVEETTKSFKDWQDYVGDEYELYLDNEKGDEGWRTVDQSTYERCHRGDWCDT